ncbi:hypothetical protein CH296_00415 [Rhodococcus sp. 14-2496-1d]|nr:hypothetical protein CH296_00415 [Rhodococcus sp. 14-2496-1d]
MALISTQSGAAALVPRPTGAPDQEGIGTMADTDLDEYTVEINGYPATLQLNAEDAKKRGLKAADKTSARIEAAAQKAAEEAAAKEEKRVAEEQKKADADAAKKAADDAAAKAAPKAPANKAVTSPANKAATAE